MRLQQSIANRAARGMAALLVATAALAQSDPNEAVSLTVDPGVPEEAFIARQPDVTNESVPSPPSPSIQPSPDVTLPDQPSAQMLATAIQTESAEAIAVDDYENAVDGTDLDPGNEFVPSFDWLSPSEPGGRDNFTISFGATVGYDNNVLFSASNVVGSATATASLGMQYVVGTPRFDLFGDLNLATTYFQNRPGGNEQNTFTLLGGSQYQFRPRTQMSLRTSTSYLAQPDPDVIGNTTTDNGSYFVTDTSFDLSYELRPRLSLVANYAFNAIRYDSEVINEQSGFVSQNFSGTANWLLTPRTIILGQLRFNPITYYAAGQGSDGYILLVGLTQTMSPRLEWTLRGGGEYRKIRNPDDALGATTEYLGPFVEGELEYQYDRDSSILANLRYGTEPSGVGALVLRQSFRFGVFVDHRFGRRLSTQFGLNYQNDAFDFPGDTGYSQAIPSGSLTLRYEFNPSIAGTLSGTFYMLRSDLPDADFNRNTVTMGLEISL